MPIAAQYQTIADAVRIALAALAGLTAHPPPAADSGGAPFAAAVLAAHNAERSALDVAPLRWSGSLAADAADYAAELARRGYLVHSAGNDEGENLWAGTAGAFPARAMVGLWLAEKRYYRPGVFPANSRTRNWEDVGHYTQMIWSTTHEIGCAVASNGATDFMVCRYGEGGNVFGERPV